MSDVKDVSHLFRCPYFTHTHLGDECYRPDSGPPCSPDCPEFKTHGEGWSTEHYPQRRDYAEHVRRVVGEDDPERIWLQNANDAGHWEEGRLWCADKVWPDEPEDGEPTEYIRADLHAAAQAEIARLRETEEAYRELFKRSCEKTVYIAECEAEIERLREQHELALRAHDAMAAKIEQLRKEVECIAHVPIGRSNLDQSK